MLRMAQVQYIKDLYENEEKSLREISRITGHSFETVQKYAQKENWNEDNLPDTEPTSYPVLGEFIPIVDGWLYVLTELSCLPDYCDDYRAEPVPWLAE